MIGHMISNSTVGPKTLSISLMRLFLDFHPMTYVRDLHTLISVLAALGSTKKPPGHPTTYDAATTEKTPNGLIFKLPFFSKILLTISILEDFGGYVISVRNWKYIVKLRGYKYSIET